MDAETRQQLKTNELADRLLKVGAWVDRNWLHLTIALAAVVGTIVAARFWSSSRKAAAERAWAEMLEVQLEPSLGDAPLDQLRRMIDETQDEQLRQVCRLRVATGLMRRGIDGGDDKLLAESQAAFEQLLSGVGDDRNLHASVLFRLGSVYESRRNLDKAREVYTSLTTDARFEGNPLREMASARLSSLDMLKSRVEFAPGVAPPPAIPDLPPELMDSAATPTTSSAPGSGAASSGGASGSTPATAPADVVAPTTQPASADPASAP